ncbi:pesticin domain protein [uncultured phage_MedDCM-OCT-S42-C7]|uniref:Pesticin domain protein n=1 Tax=uncultured phage_MedDCM-OCT-S42-C7 TaxID=2741073 RepID=A0A6S4P7R7_9CAUD|nr:pesticin domain protein [uncultured phage_MedDCM-OCT-S42-C7]BAQ94121.1 pesticin domain protein [uncultured phage_MedDCM-OCT-S42-C7]
MSNIDFDFILKQEGFETKGYVPDAENSNSGVTIASGFDLGARVLEDLKGLPQDIIDVLTPFLSLRGAEAQEVASNLNVSEDQAKIINEFAKSEAITNLRTEWENTTGTSFDDLSKEKATVLASVAFQYGNLEKATPNFWKQTTSGDWEGAYNNLLDFGDRYDSRRKEEANYLFPTLKKTDTTLIDNQLKADALRMDGSLPEVMMNPYIDDEAKTEILKTETENTLGSGVVEASGNFISNLVDDLKQINEDYEETGQTELDKIQEDYNQKVEKVQVNEAAFEKGKDEFVYANQDKIVEAIEKQNQELEETDFLEGHKNPSFLDPMLDVPTISEQDQFQIDKVNADVKEKLSKEFSYLDIGKAAIDQEWITSWILKHNGREDLNPNYEFGINDFVLSKEQQDELREGVNPDYWDAFEKALSYPELKRIKEKILDVQKKEKVIMSKGIATGLTARFLAAVLDPTAWAAAIATDGILAPAIVMNKANRIQRIIRGGLAAGTTNFAIEGALVSQNPTLGTKELLIAASAGFVLGGTIRGIKSRNMSDDDIALNKAMDDYTNVKEKEILDEAELQPTTKGNKKYDVANKTEQDDYDKVADEYNKDLADRTTIRTDGNTEIRMPDGEDEYIITKDGKIYKCD